MKEESELREKERILFSIMQYMPLCCDEENARNRSAMNCSATNYTVTNRLEVNINKLKTFQFENMTFLKQFNIRYLRNISTVAAVFVRVIH